MIGPGAVVIGRNEGERLRLCLGSLLGRCAPLVYVDSGSADGSAALARSLGAEVVELDRSRPFSAARARNEGFERLRRVAPGVAYVQFVDGDCEVVPGWIDRAAGELDARPDAAVVCGRRRERHPERSIFHRLGDLEWDTPVGEAESCGGDALMRAAPFAEAGGFDPTIAAGEEPDLCARLRRAGWKVLRIEAEMTRHDLDMTRAGQWWRRQVRGGYGSLDVASRNPGGPFARQVRSARIWTAGWLLALLVAILAAARWPGPATTAAVVAVAAAPVAQALRIARKYRRRSAGGLDAIALGFLTVAGKWGEVAGQARALIDRAAGRRAALIEYRRPPPSPADCAP